MTSALLRRLEADVGELLDRHETTRELADFARWADQPVGFCREVLKGEPWSRQVDIMEAVRDDPLVVVRSSNAAGKDWTAARLALWWTYARRGRVLLMGPTLRQVREIVMVEVARAFALAADLPGELFAGALRVPHEEQAGILAFTSTEASKLTGFHAPRVLVVLTEAQGCEEFAWEAAHACATGEGDRVLAVGNPLMRRGRFYVASRSRTWTSLRIPASEHPNIVEGREVIPGGPSPAFVERMASEYGRSSGIYRARVDAEFPDVDEDALVLPEWIDAAVERWRDRKPVRPDAPIVLSVDPARFGSDRSVLCVLRDGACECLREWSGLSTVETAKRVHGEAMRLDEARDWRVTVVVDETGLGGGVVDRLRELGSVHVEGFIAAASPDNVDRFLNRRAEAYWCLRSVLEAGNIALPDDPALSEELLATTWIVTSVGKIQIEAKVEIRKRIGRSPDRADAVAMAVSVRPRPVVDVY